MSPSTPRAPWLPLLTCVALATTACTAPTTGPGGGGDDDDDDHTVPDPLPPVLVSVTAKQAGQFGDHVRFDVVGRDPEANAGALRITHLDVAGDPIFQFDADGDGEDESATHVYAMQLPILSATDAPGVLYIPDLQRVTFDAVRFRVSLVDHQGLVSDELTADLQMQEVLGRDAACDRTYVDSRCEDGLSCRGESPAVCVEGEPPVITQAAYLNDELGPRVLVRGDDPDDDVDVVRVDFMNDEGLSVSVDLDNDGAPDSSHFTFDDLRIGRGGQFFHRFDPSVYFTSLVTRMAFRVTDRGGRTSERVETDLGPAALRNIGADCDPRGFDLCRDSICSPGIVGERNRCQSTSVARRAACNEAPEVRPTSGVVSVRGSVRLPSLWSAPEGCVPDGTVLRPDAVVKVVLERDVARLRISTGDAYTSFDTVLYVIDDCAADPVVAWCRDDQQGAPRPWLARLEVENLPAGTYFVVIDSFQPIESGDFQLDMVAE